MIKKRYKKKEDIEPLKRRPDYLDQRKKGSISHNAAINLNRIYFVDEDYNRLIVSSEEIREGGEPTRFTGQLPYIPIPGKDVVSNDDFSRKFEVIRRHLVPNLSMNIPPKVYIVLREI